MITPESLLDKIVERYLTSRDFNGYRVSSLLSVINKDWGQIEGVVRQLIEDELLGIITTDEDPDPAIIRRGFLPKGEQLSKLSMMNPSESSFYPRPKALRELVDSSKYEGRPYRLLMAQGEAQLAFRTFDVSILEFYRNDPRYFYQNNDISGSICINDEFFENDSMPDHDQILLKSFGFSYDEKFNRGVAVVLKYLADLSPEHQQVWKAKEINKVEYRLHPEYFKTALLGHFSTDQPIFLAFGNELFLINKMVKAIGRPNFFRKDFGEHNETKHRKFGFLVRPTLEEYNSFILLLDKLLSENINKKFFASDINFEAGFPREDGKVEVRKKGMIDAMNEWMRLFYKTEDWTHWERVVKTFKKVRRMRQRPAHALDDNIFDQKYFKEQRELIIEAYIALQAIRMIFEQHPDVLAAKVEVPSYLAEGKILTY